MQRTESPHIVCVTILFPLCSPTLIYCSVALWKDLTDFFITYFFSHFIIFEFWRTCVRMIFFWVHLPYDIFLWQEKKNSCRSEKSWCVCHTLLSQRIVLLLVIKGKQQSFGRSNQAGEAITLYFCSSWPDEQVVLMRSRKNCERGVLLFKGGKRPSGHVMVLAACAGYTQDLHFQPIATPVTCGAM